MRRLTDILYHRGEVKSPSAQIPSGLCLAVVPPVQGRVNDLAALHQKILSHTATLPADTRKIILYCGDYIGRGPHSADVLDLFVSAPLPGFDTVFLVGAQELTLMSFLKGEGLFARWLDQRNWGQILPSGRYVHDKALLSWLYEQGGDMILTSYGVDVPDGPFLLPLQLAAMRHELLRKIPTDHMIFLDALLLDYTCGDYHFMHPVIQARMPHYRPGKAATAAYDLTERDDRTPLMACLMAKDKRLCV